MFHHKYNYHLHHHLFDMFLKPNHFLYIVQMLQHLQIERVQLLTNNPNKVQAVRDAGIKVVDRQPIYGTLNDYNLSYVKTKATRSGHWLSELLSGAATGK